MKINNEEEYKLALDTLIKLWDCEPNTSVGYYFEELANAIEIYERENYPLQ
jgi:antitoxin component HigA of HigAB toxin-antitoxin module